MVDVGVVEGYTRNRGFDVYKTYVAVKLHFTTSAYDYHKYNGKVNASLEQFTRRNDRYFFYKLSTRYTKDSIVDYFVSNFASNNADLINCSFIIPEF